MIIIMGINNISNATELNLSVSDQLSKDIVNEGKTAETTLKEEILDPEKVIVNKILGLINDLSPKKNAINRSPTSICESIINELLTYKHDGYGLGDILMGIDVNTISSKNNIVSSNLLGNANYSIKVKDGSSLSKLLQLYLTFIGGKSVQFEDFKNISSSIDGKLQRFSKQAITQFQEKRVTKRGDYERRLGNIRDDYHTTVKRTEPERNNDVIRNVKKYGTLEGLALFYGPETQEIAFQSFGQEAYLNMNEGKLSFVCSLRVMEYPIQFPFVRDDKALGKTTAQDNLNEIIINDNPNSPNYKTMKQVMQTVNTINQIISDYVVGEHSKKARSRSPFGISNLPGRNGSIVFDNSLRGTGTITDDAIDKMISNNISYNSDETLGSKQQLVDFLNFLFKEANPENNPSPNKSNNQGRVIGVH